MVEQIMIFGIGFLAASLCGLLLVPLIHNRAVRLTKKRLEAAAPLSIAELQADKDQLRAEFAMSTRRLELLVEQLKAESAGQLAELGKKTDAINLFKIELDEKTKQIDLLQASNAKLQDRANAVSIELSAKDILLQETERMLASKEAEIAKITGDLNERALSTDSQRVEIITLRTQVFAFKDQIDDLRTKIEFAQKVEASLRSELATAKRDEKGDVGSTKDRTENAQLRESINEIAAEIARLTLALEGPRSPIETILAKAEGAVVHNVAHGGNGGGNGGGPIAAPAQRTLADRIRALQSRATRLASTG
ncbi:MAG TPA: hypothetical protein VLX09_12725 [Stellaceae bacterium]|nr:hypothetical protein [Xanthobacteraceae bacterium]HUK08728.1 hypothetical protein [Stellaceae bacterium]